MALKSWSTAAGSNATVGSINFAENQAPSTVNDSARALMADVRSWYEDVEWRDWGHTVAYASATTFTIATDLTATYTANRPIRCTDATTLYGRIVSSSYGAPNTTVTVILDSGSLSASLTAVSLGFKIKTLSVSNGVSSQSGTASYATNIAFTDATATRTVTVPDETGTLVLKDASTGIISTSGGFGTNTLQNIGLAASVAAKALTIALKTKALADPSTGSPVQISFRNSTLTTGDYNIRSVTAALSVVAPNGATIGFAAAATGYVYIYALDNAGTVELAISGGNRWDEANVQSTTAITATADLASVLYSTTARTNVPIRFVGRIKITTGAVAGEWDNEDTEIYVGENIIGTDVQTFTSSGTWAKRGGFSSTSRVHVEAWGGGGGGGGGSTGANAGGGGGGGGGYSSRWLQLSDLGTTETITIGAGGTGGAAGANGVSGSNTTVGSLVTAYGGGGGGAGSAGTGGTGGGGAGDIAVGSVAGTGGTQGGGNGGATDVNGSGRASPYGGGGGGGGGSNATNTPGTGESVYYGGGGGGGANAINATGAAGGTSKNGGAGGGVGVAGTQPGGGGGGNYVNQAGAAGGAGKVIVTVFQ